MRCGCDAVPNESGSTDGALEPMSRSFWLRVSTFDGVKKSVALSVPSPCTASRKTLLPSVPGGFVPGPTGGAVPLPDDSSS